MAVFEDDGGADRVRKQHADEPFDDLARHRNRIVIAGGLRPGPGEWHCGGLWVLEVAGRDEVVTL